jgi:hypothetical protein
MTRRREVPVAGPFLAAFLAWAAFLLQAGGPRRDAVWGEDTLGSIAGRYYFGDGFVSNLLTITPEGRFQSEREGCLGVYDRNEGRAEVVAGHLLLRPSRLNMRRAAVRLLGGQDAPDAIAADFFGGGRSSDLIPVRWGRRLYLVPRDEGRDFCNGVNLGLQARYPASAFYLRAGDKDDGVEGLPSVPEAWGPMLLKQPLRGKVVEVMAGRRARVDFGAEGGAWKGMEVWTEAGLYGWCEVVEVDARTCVIERFRDPEVRFEVGQAVRSRRPDVD